MPFCAFGAKRHWTGKNLNCGFREKRFLSNNSLCVHFRSYVASQVVYKCGHCEHFPSRTSSLGPSQIKLLAIYGKSWKKVIFFPKPKRIWLYCRGSVAYFVFQRFDMTKTRQSNFGFDQRRTVRVGILLAFSYTNKTTWDIGRDTLG